MPEEVVGIRVVHKIIKDKRMLKFEMWLKECSDVIRNQVHTIAIDLSVGFTADIKFLSHSS